MTLPLVVAGLTVGAVYGLAGVGVVLTYKTSGVFNFAHGALATIAAFTFYSLTQLHGWPTLAAILVSVFVLGPLLGVAFEVFARIVSQRSLAAQVTSTVGILLVVQAAYIIVYGQTQTRRIPPLIGSQVSVFGASISWDQILIFSIALMATCVLSLFLRVTRQGIAMRAVVADPDLLDLCGTSPVGTRRLAWIIGVTFAAASGVLISPGQTLNPTNLTLLVVVAFGAAAIGAFRSLPLTFVGGLIIGVLGALSTKYFTRGLLAGLPPTMPFVVLFVVLLVFPRRWLVASDGFAAHRQPSWRAPLRFQAPWLAATLVALLLVPEFAGIHLTDWTKAIAAVMLYLSLGLLVRSSGQVSLCQISFAAIGAASFSRFAVDWHLPWGIALIAAGLVAVPIGALLAVPAVRLSGLYLALATLGFGILLQYMFYTSDLMFGSFNAPLDAPRPSISWLDGDREYYYLVLALLVCTVALVISLTSTRLGRLMRALSESPLALTTGGASVSVTRVIAFVVSAFIAAVSGALTAVAIGGASQTNYVPLSSLTALTLVVVCVGGAPWYALLAGGASVLIPSYFPSTNVSNWLQIAFGGFAVLSALAPPGREGVPVRLQRAIDSRFARHRARQCAVTDRGEAGGSVEPARLEVDRLTVRFGGRVAVDGASVVAATGRITGLIGPNGAGKTTTFNACSGLVVPSSGAIRLDGRDLDGLSAAERARRGIGRTFQRIELFDSLSVRENVAMGFEASLAGASPVSHIMSRRSDRIRALNTADAMLELCDAAELAHRSAGLLPTGQRRLVELARALAGPFRILLLDEPSSGLDHTETARFGAIIRRVVDDRGVGVLLIEHDLSLVSSICEDIHVLDFGSLIFSGSPPEVMASATVQQAYLGLDLETPVDRMPEMGAPVP
jgi:ABC-type branched-subunit amino acid transport system ATPase component/branched-subunit amino acid ABC-type transport system permease component